jgi:hypothetical protein
MSASGATPKSALSEELRDLSEQIDNIKEDAQELTAPLSDLQFNWRPASGRWSISECLAHLNLANGTDLPMLVEAIEQARSAGITGKGPFRYGFLSRKFVQMNEPPAKLRFKSPKVYKPPSGLTKEAVLGEFLSNHDRMLELVAKSSGLDLARVKVPTVFRYVTFSLGIRFALQNAHDRRHLRQAWDVREHRNFP